MIALGINVFIRLGPLRMSACKNEARFKAEVDLVNKTQGLAKQMYPQDGSIVQAALQNELYKSSRSDPKLGFARDVSRKYADCRSKYLDDAGFPFLLEVDSYHWARIVRNSLKDGGNAYEYQGSRLYDRYMCAPLGYPATKTLHKNVHVYVGVAAYRLIHMFYPGVPLTVVLFYLPVVLSSILLIVIFFFTQSLKVGANSTAGFAAALCAGLSPLFLLRSQAGWFDNDVYIGIYSVLAVWALYLSLRASFSGVRRLIYAALAGAGMGLFAYTWDIWWLLFDTFIVGLGYYFIHLLLERRYNYARITAASGSVFIGLSLGWVSFFSGVEVAARFLTDPLKMFWLKDQLDSQFWPNVFLTVQELRSAPFQAVIQNAGGSIILLTAALYLLATVIRKKNIIYEFTFIVFVFVLWMSVAFIGAMKAVRLSLLLVVPLSVAFGLGADSFIQWASRRLERGGRLSIRPGIVTCLAVAVLTYFFSARSLVFSNTLPMMTRAWWKALGSIQEKTPSEAIINSWWDYGHWFKFAADRRVLFDGATQDKPVTYWMARALLATDEKEALGILRMVNSGANAAFDLLREQGYDNFAALSIINQFIIKDSKGAVSAAAKYIPEENKRELFLSYLYQPAPACMVVEPSLLSKMSRISFIGGWDFFKADIYQKFKSLKKKAFLKFLLGSRHYDIQKAQQLYELLSALPSQQILYWISAPRQFYSVSQNCEQHGSILTFDNGFIVNLADHSVQYYKAVSQEWHIPKNMYYLDGVDLKKASFADSDVDYSVILSQDGQAYRLAVCDEELVQSMFSRLYFFKGVGLSAFTSLFNEELEDNQGPIRVYTINWKAG